MRDLPKFEINDLVELRKTHPCGGKSWLITRTGIDFGLKCQLCGHWVMMPRKDFERAFKKLLNSPEVP